MTFGDLDKFSAMSFAASIRRTWRLKVLRRAGIEVSGLDHGLVNFHCNERSFEDLWSQSAWSLGCCYTLFIIIMYLSLCHAICAYVVYVNVCNPR